MKEELRIALDSMETAIGVLNSPTVDDTIETAKEILNKGIQRIYK